MTLTNCFVSLLESFPSVWGCFLSCFAAAASVPVACELFQCAIVSALWREIESTEGRRSSSKQGSSGCTECRGEGGLGAEIGAMEVGDDRRQPPQDGSRPGTRARTLP